MREGGGKERERETETDRHRDTERERERERERGGREGGEGAGKTIKASLPRVDLWRRKI